VKIFLNNISILEKINPIFKGAEKASHCEGSPPQGLFRGTAGQIAGEQIW
jgi:hypothetical protein